MIDVLCNLAKKQTHMNNVGQKLRYSISYIPVYNFYKLTRFKFTHALLNSSVGES